MMKGDYVQFANDKDQRDVILRSDWIAEWPPPEELGLLVGKLSGGVHRMLSNPVGEIDARAHIAKQGFDFNQFFEIRWFTQISASKISDEAIAKMSHVARGAAYIPKEG